MSLIPCTPSNSNKSISSDDIESIHLDKNEVWINLRRNKFRSEEKAEEFYRKKVGKWQGKSPGTPCVLLPSLTWRNDSVVYVWVGCSPNKRYYTSNFSPYHHGFYMIYYDVNTLKEAENLIELAKSNCQGSDIKIIQQNFKDR